MGPRGHGGFSEQGLPGVAEQLFHPQQVAPVLGGPAAQDQACRLERLPRADTPPRGGGRVGDLLPVVAHPGGRVELPGARFRQVEAVAAEQPGGGRVVAVVGTVPLQVDPVGVGRQRQQHADGEQGEAASHFVPQFLRTLKSSEM